MNILLTGITLIFCLINLFELLTSQQNLKVIERALKRQSEIFGELSNHLESLHTEEEQIVFVQEFLKSMSERIIE